MVVNRKINEEYNKIQKRGGEFNIRDISEQNKFL